MKLRLLAAATWLTALLALVAFATGCSKKSGDGTLKPNARPEVALTQAPIDTVQTDPQTGERLQYFYAYKLQWSGHDPDGKVDYFLYAVDPPDRQQVAAGQDTQWVRTTKNEQILFFRSSQRDPRAPSGRPTSSDFHTFVIKAVDNGKSPLQSEPQSRVFFSYTVAPSVQIIAPKPSSLLQPQVSPSVRITWNGSDPDGQFTQKPIKYKYRLYSDLLEPALIDTAEIAPSRFRDIVVGSNFAGYDSTSADTTFAVFSNLTPSTQESTTRYLFVVVGFDEAGAYSPIFDLNSSMLEFTAGFANALGPKFTVFNDYVNFTYTSGGYSIPTDPADRKVIRVQVPADRPITFNWFAEPTAGAQIKSYRWVVDLNVRGNLSDNTERTNEVLDIYHWSQKSNNTTFATMPPFEPGNHWLWIEAEDNNGVLGNAVIYFTVVRPTFQKDLLVVDDTRLEVDQRQPAPRDTLLKLPYFDTWPAAAELDTFLYAVGNRRWRGLPSPQPLTPPGVFAGYNFDTLGTRLGVEDISTTVTLLKLAPYRHVIWLTDAVGAANLGSGSDRAKPQTSLRFFGRGAANPLAAFIEAGGQAWLAGGGIGFASMIQWNRRGVGSTPYGLEFSSASNRELAPGRFMYDIAGWQTRFISSYPVRSTFTKYHGLQRAGQPDYYVPYPGRPSMANFPDEVFVRDEFNTPVYPPTRFDAFYQPGGNIPSEYLADATTITENIGGVDIPTLDTLLVVNGGLIDTQYPGNPTWVTPLMTYYHPTRRGGPDATVGGIRGSVMTSGFAPWDFTRESCIQLVDFVLHDVWGMTRNASVARQMAAGSRSASPGVRPATEPSRRVIQGHLPIGRNRE